MTTLPRRAIGQIEGIGRGNERFIFDAHGQTFFNQEGLVQGACDSSSDRTGQDQARQTGAYLKERGIRFGQLYSSTQGAGFWIPWNLSLA